jgi:hypothetical protein
MEVFRMLLLWFFCINLLSSVSAQSREIIDRLSEGTCPTCRVAGFCQPHPDAGSPDHREEWYRVEDFWGAKQEITIGGREFNIFNADETQINLIREALEILPPEYINILPKNFRIGNPNRPFGIVSAGRTIGGSKFCMPYREENLEFESIVLHEAIFTISNKKHRTILHEAGHFFSRKFEVFERMTREEVNLSDDYLRDVYQGKTSSHDETIAQCFMFFFHQMYFDGNNRLITPKTFEEIVALPARKYLRWMNDFIKPVIRETSSL